MREFTLIIFFLANLLVIWKSLQMDYKSPIKEGVIFKREKKFARQSFHKMNYFKRGRDGRELYLRAKQLLATGPPEIYNLQFPEGVVKTPRGQKIDYKAEKGIFFKDEEKLILQDKVEVVSEENRIKADWAQYIISQERVDAKGNVWSRFLSSGPEKILIESNLATTWPVKKVATYEENVRGNIDPAHSKDPHTYFEAQWAKADQNSGIIELKNKVYLSRSPLKAWGHRGTLYLNKNNRGLKSYKLQDDVKVVEKWTDPSGIKQLRRSFSEHLRGSIATKKIVLMGYPKVLQGKDVIKGNVITIFEGREVVEVDDSSGHFTIKEGK